MANTIKQKRGTADPGANDLVVGELAINTTDGGVFTKTDGGTVVELGSSINLDTSPQLGGDLASNGHDILVADNDRLKFGDAADLEIYHDGAETNIVGQTLVSIDTSFLRFRNIDGNKNTATFTHTTGSTGGVQLYFDGNKKFNTTDDGVTITGNIVVGDDDRLKFGDAADLEIYHDSANGNSVISESGSGNLNIGADNLVIYNSAATETKAKFVSEGAVALYYDNVKKFETATDGIAVTGDIALGDDDRIKLGAGTDLEIYHDSTNNNSVIKENGSASLVLAGDNVQIKNNNGTEFKAQFNTDASVILYYNNIEEFRTVDGGIEFDKVYKSGVVDFYAEEIRFIKHGTTSSFLAKFTEDTSVALYHAGAPKFFTRTYGALVIGTCKATEFDGSGALLSGVVKTNATGISGASTVSNIVTISQADYDAISSPDASTIYYITS
ncbi:autotransport protein MisL-like [uncultured Mediterranean phage uvMED]|nr:autotransport protein MisL-like [uncultured Mediterranean phage uvMED]BAR23183.1 autotransport protein MisL-like [uncultured Mediterranean phage uvMED]